MLEKLEPHEEPPRESTLRMRLILKYRLDENGNKSPKARIVMLGYFDRDRIQESTSSITNHDKRHWALTVTVRFMEGVLCSHGRRKRCVPARSQASARRLATTSTRTGGCSELEKAANGQVEAPVEGTSAFLQLEEHRGASPKIRPMLLDID